VFENESVHRVRRTHDALLALVGLKSGDHGPAGDPVILCAVRRLQPVNLREFSCECRQTVRTMVCREGA
jgi:hypothetical protein